MNHTLDDSVGQMLTAMQTHSQRAAGPRQIALAEVVRSSGAGLQLRCAGLLYDAPSLWGAPGLALEAGERVVVCTEDGQTLYILGRVEPLG